MSTALETLLACGERQKQLFFSNFLSRNRIGEIVCVQTPSEDSVLFERWEIHGKGFVSTTILLSEDSLVVAGKQATYRPIENFVEDRERANKERFAQLHELLKKDNMTLEEAKKKAVEAGQDPSIFDYRELKRHDIEDRLPPGKKTIQGDRRSEIMVCERQLEIPNDLQQASLNVYRVYIPEFLKDFIELKEEDDIVKWIEENTAAAPLDIGLSTTLPFVKQIHYVSPVIYQFPANEVDVEKEIGYK